jgi:hypothetical protein
MKLSNEVVLLYNFDPEKLNKIKFVLIRMGVKIKIVSSDMYQQPIGYLVGIKGIKKAEEHNEENIEESILEHKEENTVEDKEEIKEQNKEENKEINFSDEMLVMKGFVNSRIDELLKQLKKNGIERIHLKAVVTEYNQNWNSIELYKELKLENEQMSSKN